VASIDRKKPSYLQGTSYIQSESEYNGSDLGIESNNSERTQPLEIHASDSHGD